jgi:hypothetical protein
VVEIGWSWVLCYLAGLLPGILGFQFTILVIVALWLARTRGDTRQVATLGGVEEGGARFVGLCGPIEGSRVINPGRPHGSRLGSRILDLNNSGFRVNARKDIYEGVNMDNEAGNFTCELL